MKILFCLPGSEYSGRFLTCWTNLLIHCLQRNYQINVAQRSHEDCYSVRNMCLGGPNQKPFGGKVDYDYIMWIDSDILFTPQHLEQLLDHDVDIIGGVYPTEDTKYYTTLQYWDEDYYRKNGCFKMMSVQEVNDMKKQYDTFPVVATGFGFMLVKNGVFENMTYPWFKPELFRVKRLKYFASEDVNWCMEANKLGYKVMIDPNVVLQREVIKMV
jgi:hypothetical protein